MEHLKIAILFFTLCLCRADIRHIKKGKMKITIASMVPHNNKKLNTKVLKTVQVSNKEECIKECSSTDGCQSANYDKKSKCDVLATNRHVNKTNFVTANSFIHMSLNNKGCESGMCQNSGTCIPNYKDNTFQCQCDVEYEGKYCHIKKKLSLPNWWFSFDHNTTNLGTSPSDATITAEKGNKGNGVLMGVADRKGKYLHCDRHCVDSEISWRPFIDPKLSKEGVTMAMWIQMTPGEEKRQTGFNLRTHVLCRFGKGYCLMYANKVGTWDILVSTHTHFMTTIPMDISETLNWHYVGLTFNGTTLTAFVDSAFGFVDVESGDDSEVATEYLELFNPSKVSPSIFNVDEFKLWYQSFTIDQLKNLYETEKKRIYGEK